MKALEITGKVFNRLTAIRRVPNDGRRIKWEFRCECGAVKAINIDGVVSGKTKSCGCLRVDVTRETKTTHGHCSRGVGSASPEFRSWLSAKTRCYNENFPQYCDYGGRGIGMSSEWRDDFAKFLSDMGPRPANTTLDRIDCDGNYEAGNCRWADWKTQARNRTNTVYVEHDGKKISAKEFSETMNVDTASMYYLMRSRNLSVRDAALLWKMRNPTRV